MGNGHSAIDKLIALTTLRQYQEGGEVTRKQFYMNPAYSSHHPVGDKFVYRGVSEVPAQFVGGDEEGGMRYYTYESPPVDRGDFDFIRRNQWPTEVMQKVTSAPEDSIPKALIEQFLEGPSKKKSGLGFLKKLLKNYQQGGQVLQIPQKKELDIVWPVDGESPEDMEQAKYNPVTELLLEALFEKLKRQQGQQRKPGKQLDPEAIKLYTIAQPDVV